MTNVTGEVFRAGDVPFGPGADNRVEVLGLPFDILEREHVTDALETLIEAPGTRLVCPVNVDTHNQTQRDVWLRDVIREADWVYADGAGVVLGAKLLGREGLERRVTAADFIYDLAEDWNDGRYSVYFLGGEDGVAAAAAEKLKERWPGFRIAGTHHGFMSPEEEVEFFQELNELAPDVVFVGYGVPLEHRITMKYRHMTPNVGVYFMVGALTQYVAGTVPRCPDWMGDAGLEWLFRLFIEPRKKWRRYLLGNPLYVARTLRARAWEMVGRGAGRT